MPETKQSRPGGVTGAASKLSDDDKASLAQTNDIAAAGAPFQLPLGQASRDIQTQTKCLGLDISPDEAPKPAATR